MNLNQEQLRCFESPAKASIIAALRAWGPSSAKELSQVIDNGSGSLYHHLRHLVKVGLLRISEVRPADTRPESVYELTSKEFFMRGNAVDQDYQVSVFRSAKNILRLTQRQYERALSVLPKEPELEQALRFNFVSTRMSPKNLARFKADMEALLLAALSTHDPDGVPVIFAGLLAPSAQTLKR